MQNRKVGPFNVEVWSNPDVGTGSFYVIIDPPKGSGLSVPADMKVQVAVQPVSKRLPVAVYSAWREKLLDHVEFKTLVPFDKEEMWHVHITFCKLDRKWRSRYRRSRYAYAAGPLESVALPAAIPGHRRVVVQGSNRKTHAPDGAGEHRGPAWRNRFRYRAGIHE